MSEEAKRFLRVREVAAMMHRVPDTIYRWIEEARLPAVRLPTGGLLIPADAVARLLEPQKGVEDCPRPPRLLAAEPSPGGGGTLRIRPVFDQKRLRSPWLLR